MTKINYNFSEQPANVAELFCTLGVLQVVVIYEEARDPGESKWLSFLNQLSFLKISSTVN